MDVGQSGRTGARAPADPLWGDGGALAIPLEMERLTGHGLGGEKLVGGCWTGSELCGAQGLFLELPSAVCLRPGEALTLCAGAG